MQRHTLLKVSFWAAAIQVVVLAAGCLLLPHGYAQATVSDLMSGGLMLAALLAFAAQGLVTKGRLRWFWILQACGWTLWLADQCVWIYYDVYLQQKMPAIHPADAFLFLAGAPMMAGFLLRPHREPSESTAHLGALEFTLLLLWWVYMYVAVITCWQYVFRNETAYNRNFDALSSVQNCLIAGVVAAFWFRTSGKWKRFYAYFFGAVVFNGIWFYLLNRALQKDIYFTGSWYDIPYSGSFALYAACAYYGEGLTPVPEGAEDSYVPWMTNLAMIAVLSLPILAIVALADSRLPANVAKFRVMVTLLTMFLMALLLFIQHRRLNRELQRTNIVLEEASLTDPLTGLRNRRYFSATIEGDVGQSLRSHTDNHDPHTRDLVFYLIDADNFKEVNDQYGHDVGDAVLVEMAHRLSSSIRHSDVLVRWGGEEFLIVSRYTDRREAEWLAQRVLSAVADKPFTLGESGKTITRTCSLGWAAFPWFPDNPKVVSYEEVLTLADRGLHRAKESGRNCAVGMLPASGKVPATTVAGLHSNPLQVDVLAVAGPHPSV